MPKVTIHYLVQGVEKTVEGTVGKREFFHFFPNGDGTGYVFLRPTPRTAFEYLHELDGFREGMGFDREINFAEASTEFFRGELARASFSAILFPQKRKSAARAK